MKSGKMYRIILQVGLIVLPVVVMAQTKNYEYNTKPFYDYQISGNKLIDKEEETRIHSYYERSYKKKSEEDKHEWTRQDGGNISIGLPPGPTDDPDVPDPVPFDGGLSLLVAAGVCYGIKKAANRRKSSKH